MKTKFSFNCTFKLDSFSFEQQIFRRSAGEEGVVQVTGETYNLSALPQVRLHRTSPLNRKGGKNSAGKSTEEPFLSWTSPFSCIHGGALTLFLTEFCDFLSDVYYFTFNSY